MRKTPDWHHQTHLERRRLAISLTESPIEALFAGELATSPSFGVCRTKPALGEISRGRIALVPQQPAGMVMRGIPRQRKLRGTQSAMSGWWQQAGVYGVIVAGLSIIIGRMLSTRLKRPFAI